MTDAAPRAGRVFHADRDGRAVAGQLHRPAGRRHRRPRPPHPQHRLQRHAHRHDQLRGRRLPPLRPSRGLSLRRALRRLHLRPRRAERPAGRSPFRSRHRGLHGVHNTPAVLWMPEGTAAGVGPGGLLSRTLGVAGSATSTPRSSTRLGQRELPPCRRSTIPDARWALGRGGLRRMPSAPSATSHCSHAGPSAAFYVSGS